MEKYYFFKIIILYFSMFLVLFIHEFGHYFAAKIIMIRPKKVVIGYGKSIFKVKKFIFNIFPISGYTDISPKDLFILSRLGKSMIILGGSFSNIFFGFVLMFSAILTNPNITKIPLYETSSNFFVIKSINGIKIENFYDTQTVFKSFLLNSNKKRIQIKIKNGVLKTEKTIKTSMKDLKTKLTYREIYLPLNPVHSFKLKIKSFFNKVNKHSKKQTTEQMTIENVLWTIGILSIFTGIFNLIPIRFFGQASDGYLFVKVLLSKYQTVELKCDNVMDLYNSLSRNLVQKAIKKKLFQISIIVVIFSVFVFYINNFLFNNIPKKIVFEQYLLTIKK